MESEQIQEFPNMLGLICSISEAKQLHAHIQTPAAWFDAPYRMVICLPDIQTPLCCWSLCC